MTITTHNLDGYGAPPIEWSRLHEVLTSDLTQGPGTGGPNRHTAWLTTLNSDGSPHVTPVGVVTAADGIWYFTSGPRTRKSRNLARDPRCVVSVATDAFDIVIEATANQVTDDAELDTVAATFREQGWPAVVDGKALTADYSAPSAGPPPWHAYRVIAATVYALGTSEPYGATRFDMGQPG
ncbi:pyridoxamine 5'-phosphate oxidase family protein [Mycobacterium sp.]|uniref:pyridoxamine 5'-phosphate oxidase family protein n=1 Tax=Mycobacterium sp. TaxID=1785 RepID=UPI003C71EBD5